MVALFAMIPVSCRADELYLKCGEDKCLNYRFVCDGAIDCRNGTDEIDCGKCKMFERYIILSLH